MPGQRLGSSETKTTGARGVEVTPKAQELLQAHIELGGIVMLTGGMAILAPIRERAEERWLRLKNQK